jgi:hypothetical protein
LLAISTIKTTARSFRSLRAKGGFINDSQSLGGKMKAASSLASFAVFTLVLSAGAFAKDSHSGKFTLSESAKVGTTELQAGDYKAEWNGPADNLQVSIIQRGQTVATTQGHLKTLERPAPYSAVSESTLPDQTKRVDEIDFDHSKEALVVGGE